jgi:hypothetical protein
MKVFPKILRFKRKYPFTIAWRIRKHSSVVEKHLEKDEKVLYAFTGQYNTSAIDFMHTAVFVLTDKRLLIGVDRVMFGYFLYSITPDMFNDLTITSGLLWGKVTIDTVKEEVIASNISKSALPEISENITKYMMEAKKEYPEREKK